MGRVIYKDFKVDKFHYNFLHSHFMGSTGMSMDSNQGICNRFGQVHGISNLWISGPSLFSSYGYANPTLTIIALALYQVEYISKKINNT